MRRLVSNTFVTLDGVMQAPGGPEEDPSGGFTLGGWSVNYWDDAMGRVMDEFMGKPFDLLLGRKTYEIFAAHWPHASEAEGAGPLNAAHKYVATRTLDRADWKPSTLFRDVPREVADLKNGDGPEIQVHGSSDLIQTLLEHELIDEMRVWTFPLIVGGGKRLFGDGTIPRNLRITDSSISTTGVVMAAYEFAGAIRTGSFALETPSDAELVRRQKQGS
jgi:dihydrofolate reductase